MKKLAVFVAGCIVIAALVLASGQPTTHAQGNPPTPTSYGLQLYEGDGWYFWYPASATLETISETEMRIMGPDVGVRALEGDAMFTGPAYMMDVVVYDNPDRLFPEVWAEQHLLAMWQEANEAGGPNPLPVTDDGQVDPTKFQSLIVNWQPAARIEFFGGDGPIYRYYLSAGDKIVMFGYHLSVAMNHPLAPMQEDVYLLIMSTFEVAPGN